MVIPVYALGNRQPTIAKGCHFAGCHLSSRLQRRRGTLTVALIVIEQAVDHYADRIDELLCLHLRLLEGGFGGFDGRMTALLLLLYRHLSPVE
jgi:hypothetical protein